jgi:hypothetical protein
MASITLAEASKLGLDDLVAGVIENIVTVNPIYNVLPFQTIDGNAKAYNRENTLGDVQVLGINGTITAKAAPSYTKITTSLSTIIGDAEVNGLLMAQRIGQNGGNDLAAQNIASKAKSVGRKYQDLMINGDVDNANEFDGLIAIMSDVNTPASQVIAVDDALSFAKLDELLHQVKSKDGQVDFLMMNERTIRSYRALQRALGGSTPEYVTVAGVQMPAYAGVPIYRNDWIPVNLPTVGSPSTTTATVVFAGNFDDGSERVGIAGLSSAMNMGVHVEEVGASETKDNHIFRVKFYSSFVMYSGLSVAMLSGVTD